MATNVPNVAPAVYAQSTSYNTQIPFGQQPPRTQPTSNNLSASHHIGTVSSPFPHVLHHPNAGAAAGLSPHNQLPGPYASTGAITNSILPASVVDDNQTVPFPGSAAAEALHNSYPWSDSGLTSQPITSGALAQRMHYSGQIQQHMRQQQSNGMMTSRIAGNPRGDGATTVANGGIIHSSGFHSQHVNPVGSVLTHVGVGGAFSGMSPIPQGTNQALMPLMGTPSAYSEGEASAGRHSFAPAQLDMMGGPLRTNLIGGKSPGAISNRTPYEGVGAFMRNPINAPLLAAPDLSPAAFGATTAPPQPPPPGPPTPPLSGSTNGGGVKAEDSSGPLSRSMKPPRARSTRSRRKSQPPGTPCVPVHLRNPKKGRDRVFRKCQVCNHDNHIRRSNCDSCKQPLPAGKRKRDGSMSYAKTSTQKQQQSQSSAHTSGGSVVSKSQQQKQQQPQQQPQQPSPIVTTTSARNTATPLAPAHPTLNMEPLQTGSVAIDSASSGGTVSGPGAASSLASPDETRTGIN